MHSGDHETKGKMPWNANLSSSSFIKYTKMSLNHYFWQKFHIKWKLTLWKPHNLSHTIIHLNPRCSLRHCLLFLTRCHSWFSSHLQHTFSKRQAEVFNRNKTKTRGSSINSWWFASCLQGGKTFCASFYASLIAGSRRAFLCVQCVCLLLEFWVKCTRCERLLAVKH